jgi:hypothetical protein
MSEVLPAAARVLDVLNHQDTTNVPDERPPEDGPHKVTLCLHVLQGALVCERVESYLRLVFVFLLEDLELFLSLRLVLQVWVIEIVRSFNLAHLKFFSFL